MDPDYRARELRARAIAEAVDRAFDRRCLAEGLSAREPERALAAMAEREAVRNGNYPFNSLSA